jgi:predicted transcriptional regulator
VAIPELRRGSWAEALLSFVQRYPGVHLREIRRRLAIPIGTLDYHLYQLGRKGLIAVRLQGGYKCCFPETPVGFGTPIPEEEKLLLGLLRQVVPRAILLQLYLEGPTAPGRLGEAIGTTGSNLSYFLGRLETVGVLARDGPPGHRMVRLADPERVHAILLHYPPLPERPFDRFAQYWAELHP